MLRGMLLCVVLVLLAASAAWAGVDTTFTGNENIPDGTKVHAGQVLAKWWECRNTGDEVIKGCYVKVVPNRWGKGGTGLIGPTKPTLLKATQKGVSPGQTFRVEAMIRVPKDLAPGRYELDVKLCDKRGRIFAPEKKPLYILVDVVK